MIQSARAHLNDTVCLTGNNNSIKWNLRCNVTFEWDPAHLEGFYYDKKN